MTANLRNNLSEGSERSLANMFVLFVALAIPTAEPERTAEAGNHMTTNQWDARTNKGESQKSESFSLFNIL